MDQDQDSSHKEFHVNLLILPTELLVYIISFLSSLCDRVKLRYVSRWLRCVVEDTPSLWKEFVWPYYDSCEECCVNEVLKMSGQHVKVLSFPYCRESSTRLVEMLQYCSNVQHLSLPSTKLNREQLQKITNHMGCLQALELKVDDESDIEHLFSNTSHLKEITIISDCHLKEISECRPPLGDLFMHWKEKRFRPPHCNVVSDDCVCVIEFLDDYAAQLTTIPTGYTANFRVFNAYKVPLNFSPSLPVFQLQIEASGKVTIPCVELTIGDFDDLVDMTECQYGGRIMYGLRLRNNYCDTNTINIAKPHNLKCVTHFDLSHYYSLKFTDYNYLEQLAIACPNLQRLNLQNCYYCLEILQGLKAIANHCHYLLGLNILGLCVPNVEARIQLWEILSDMKLTNLVVNYCVVCSEVTSKERLICLLQKCLTIKGIECGSGLCDYDCEKLDTLMLSHFKSLRYCYLRKYTAHSPTIVQDMVNNCKELKCVRIVVDDLSLDLVQNYNLQQLCIQSIDTDVPDDFMTSVSAHGGLVHVFLDVWSLTAEGITSLVRNSPKLITLYFNIRSDVGFKHLDATLKKMCSNRKLFTTGYCGIMDNRYSASDHVLHKRSTDLVSLWN